MTQSLDILRLIGLTLLVAVVGFVALMLLRKRFLVGGSDDSGGFIPLHELRAMRDRGEIDADEYERLRAAALAGASRGSGKTG